MNKCKNCVYILCVGIVLGILGVVAGYLQNLPEPEKFHYDDCVFASDPSHFYDGAYGRVIEKKGPDLYIVDIIRNQTRPSDDILVHAKYLTISYRCEALEGQ